MGSETDDLERQLRQNLKLRRQLGVAAAPAKNSGGWFDAPAPQAGADDDDLGKLRLELKLRLAMEATIPPKESDFQSEDRPARTRRSEHGWRGVDWKVALVGLVSLVLVALAILWLIYG
jgi:hypothetical protein